MIKDEFFFSKPPHNNVMVIVWNQNMAPILLCEEKADDEERNALFQIFKFLRVNFFGEL